MVFTFVARNSKGGNPVPLGTIEFAVINNVALSGFPGPKAAEQVCRQQVGSGAHDLEGYDIVELVGDNGVVAGSYEIADLIK